MLIHQRRVGDHELSFEGKESDRVETTNRGERKVVLGKQDTRLKNTGPKGGADQIRRKRTQEKHKMNKMPFLTQPLSQTCRGDGGSGKEQRGGEIGITTALAQKAPQPEDELSDLIKRFYQTGKV